MRYLVETLPNIGVTLVSVEGDSPAQPMLKAMPKAMPKAMDIATVTITESGEMQIKYGDQVVKVDVGTGLEPGSVEVRGSYVRLKHELAARRRDASLVDLPEDKWGMAVLKACGSGGFRFMCCNCQQESVLDSRGNVTRVNEMPSEFWAEFMDFWHCHKPSLEDDKTKALPLDAKYIDLKPRSGELLVGNSFFQVCKETIEDKVTIGDGGSPDVDCINCKHKLGTIDHRSDLITLQKRNLTLQLGSETRREIYADYLEVLASIVSLLKFNSARYFRIVAPDGTKLFLWLLAYEVDVHFADKHLSDSYKLLYCDKVDKSLPNIEEVTIQNQTVFDSFCQKLADTNHCLPSQSQHFCEWSVSYLSVNS
ncbi:hypothetical protein RNJ44_00569 [Nakaseomyces bracarensis]|uniref:Ubiquitin-conjugating enzyme E2C-binding protein n=1 Tax=Nakaseomyces bracarensis TaxID=273131 RepID=A0ABR4NSY1_9SACH